MLYYLFEKGTRSVNVFFFDDRGPGIIVESPKANGKPKKHHDAEGPVTAS
ncbi:MAG: hypothetical protein U5J63_17915 [Fodinibius sp.]|nr:hypothetical protein [Fodinibius sp.]